MLAGPLETTVVGSACRSLPSLSVLRAAQSIRVRFRQSPPPRGGPRLVLPSHRVGQGGRHTEVLVGAGVDHHIQRLSLNLNPHKGDAIMLDDRELGPDRRHIFRPRVAQEQSAVREIQRDEQIGEKGKSERSIHPPPRSPGRIGRMNRPRRP